MRGEFTQRIGTRALQHVEHGDVAPEVFRTRRRQRIGEEMNRTLCPIALDAGLMGNLSARVSFDVRHDTDPLPGFEATDTTTKFSLVYKVP